MLNHSQHICSINYLNPYFESQKGQFILMVNSSIGYQFIVDNFLTESKSGEDYVRMAKLICVDLLKSIAYYPQNIVSGISNL